MTHAPVRSCCSRPTSTSKSSATQLPVNETMRPPASVVSVDEGSATLVSGTAVSVSRSSA